MSGEQGVVSLETMLRGICKKETFLDLLENFIIYDHSGGSYCQNYWPETTSISA